MTPEHILMTADTVGGVWTYALELARALEPHGVTVSLATMGGPLDAAQRRAVDALGHVTLFESRYRLEWMKEPWDDVAEAGDWLLALEDRLEPDLVHLNMFAHGALPWRAPTLLVGHSCVCSWYDAVRGEPPPPRYDRYRREVTRGLEGADLVTAPTAAMLQALRRHYGPFEAAGAVYNGRRADRFQPGEKEPLILAAGRLWDEAKNVAALAQVAPALPWPVCVAGAEAGPDGGGVSLEGVRRLGRLAPEKLATWMGRAAIYALPARYEPFGLTALEAALSGCALVLGDVPSLREVWGDAALYVPPDAPHTLEAALRALIEDPARREGLASEARQRARRYTPDRMAAAYLVRYHRLLHASAPTKTMPAQTATL